MFSITPPQPFCIQFANIQRYVKKAMSVAALGLLSTQALADTVVGSTPAEFNVSNGSASYSIPIQVAPGRGGMQPDLSLNYSGGSNGILGVGWSLGGLSSIHRCPANVEQDGFIAGITFTDKDRYCLDGQRLIPVSGANGAVGTEYKTEIDGYSQIKSYGGSANNPSYFIAKTKAGQVITFGGGGNASVIFPQGTTAWGVRTINDSTGNNPITYEYFIDGNTQYLDEVNYVGGKAEVVYEIRPDKQESFFAGQLINTEKRISSLHVYSRSMLMTRYHLAYEVVGASSQSRLTELQQCDEQSRCLSSVKINWVGDDQGRLDTSSYWSTNYSNASGWDNPIYYGTITSPDLNADGLPDICGRASGGIYCALNTGSGFSTASYWSTNYSNASGWDNCSGQPFLASQLEVFQ